MAGPKSNSFDFDGVLASLDALTAAAATSSTVDPSADSIGDGRSAVEAAMRKIDEFERWSQALPEALQPLQRLQRVQQAVDAQTKVIRELVESLLRAQAVLERQLAVAYELQNRAADGGERTSSETAGAARDASADPSDSQRNTVPMADILGYARRLARFSAPPPTSGVPANPPIPQDAHMKRSMLFLPAHLQLAPDASDARNGDAHDGGAAAEDADAFVMDVDMSQLVANPAHAPPDAAGDDADDVLDLDL
ncbi:hypothetical protein HDU83_003841 [Entophlyctis luteolus]|nr:hypothetical protein HDU83_003841 [Entophlyctis luteolus]